MKYRKKPVVIDAVQWDGENTLEVIRFCEGTAALKMDQDRNPYLLIRTLEDNDNDTKHAASKDDFIIKGVHGEFYPCKPDIFEKTYSIEELCTTAQSVVPSSGKSLEEIKELAAAKIGFTSYRNAIEVCGTEGLDNILNKAAELYAKSCTEELRKENEELKKYIDVLTGAVGQNNC